MRSFSTKYLKIPINENLGGCDYYLLRAMDVVAKSKGYSNCKSYLRSELGCSGTSTKNMTRTLYKQ